MTARASFVGVVLCLAACSSTQSPTFNEPYALIEGGYPSQVRKEYPAFISAIDGQSNFDPRRPAPLTPGKHKVDVYFSSSTVAGGAEKHVRSLDLDAAPCTRYRVVARYANLVSVDWEPVIYSEPIGECVAKFPGSK
jgi:hypothetical protein